MPKAVSKKQFRFMQALAHGAKFDHERGTPPSSVASKYSSPGKSAPEQSGENRGGSWKKKGKKSKDKSKKKSKKDLKKAFFDEFTPVASQQKNLLTVLNRVFCAGDLFKQLLGFLHHAERNIKTRHNLLRHRGINDIFMNQEF